MEKFLKLLHILFGQVSVYMCITGLLLNNLVLYNCLLKSIFQYKTYKQYSNIKVYWVY